VPIGLAISGDLKERDTGYLVRAHNCRHKGLRMKITGIA
jgi:hypothetical protein